MHQTQPEFWQQQAQLAAERANHYQRDAKRWPSIASLSTLIASGLLPYRLLHCFLSR